MARNEAEMDSSIDFAEVDQTDEIMPSENEGELGFEIVSWETPEYQRHDRPTWWYALYAAVAIGLVTVALVTDNFLFAVIIVIASFVVILHDARTPQPILVSLTSEGVIVGNRFYDYDEVKDFAIVYKPNQNLKRIYFQFKSVRKHRLSLALHDTNPLFVRENLLKYIPENLERVDEPLSEFLTRVLKL